MMAEAEAEVLLSWKVRGSEGFAPVEQSLSSATVMQRDQHAHRLSVERRGTKRARVGKISRGRG